MRLTMEDFNNAIERIVAGLEKRNRLLNPLERRVVAYHELGHAMVGLALPGLETVHKISIIPHGVGALGYTIQRPTEDRYLMTRAELEHKMAGLLGGRASEKLVFDEISTGAADDLAKATDIARAMVLRYGMSDALGNVAYDRDRQPFLQPAYPSRRSASTARGRPRPSMARCALWSTTLSRSPPRCCSATGHCSTAPPPLCCAPKP